MTPSSPEVKNQHTPASDCATSRASAEEPGPCDCDFPSAGAEQAGSGGDDTATASPQVPFSLPLKPHGRENADNIDDASGRPVIVMWGNPDDPLTLRQVDYVIAAVNSYEELKRQRDAAKAESCEMLLQRLAAERQRDELLKAVTLMYDRWENGPDCYEDPEDYTGFLGKAFKLSLEEENQIIAAIAKIKRGAL